MANTDNNTILIKVSASSPQKELVAAAAITPGFLISRDSSGTVIPHGVADGVAQKLFAVEDKVFGGDIAEVYAIGARVTARYVRSGDVVLAWIEASSTIVIGDFLTSGTGGNLQKAVTPTPGSIIGVAIEAVTTTPAARILIEIL